MWRHTQKWALPVSDFFERGTCGCATFGISHLGLCSHIPYLGTCSHLYKHPYHYHYTPTCPPVEVSRTSPYGDESGFVLSQCLAALPSVDPKSRSTAVDVHQPPPRIVNSFPREKPPPRIINPFPRENLPIPWQERVHFTVHTRTIVSKPTALDELQEQRNIFILFHPGIIC